MIYGCRICFSTQFRRITNIDFPSARTPTNLTKRASTLHDFGGLRTTSKHGYYTDTMSISWLVALLILEVLPRVSLHEFRQADATPPRPVSKLIVVTSTSPYSRWKAIERWTDIALRPIPVSKSIKFISCSVHDDNDYASLVA